MVFPIMSPVSRLFRTQVNRVEYITYVGTLTRQKNQVEEMRERRQAAVKEIEGIKWSDDVLARRIQSCQGKDGGF